MPSTPGPLFEDLLRRLATEHKREVCELKAEIARLNQSRHQAASANKRIAEGTVVVTTEEVVRVDPNEAAGSAVKACSSATATSESPISSLPDLPQAPLRSVKMRMYEESGRAISSTIIGNQPDEDALAAAFAIASDISTDTELMETVDHWTNSNSDTKADKHTEHEKADYEALQLWGKLIEHVRHEVFLDDLPKVNSGWILQDTTTFNLKNLMRMPKMSEASDVLYAASKNKGLFWKQGRVSSDVTKSDDKPVTGVQLFANMAMDSIRTVISEIPLRPSCRFRMMWDLLGVVLLVHDLVMIPMMLYDSDAISALPESYETFQLNLDIVSALFWSLDIGMCFITSYYSTSGFIEGRMRYIAYHYCRSWFPCDFSIVLVDWITIVAFGKAQGYMKVGKTASRLMRIARLLRFVKMSKTLDVLMARINSEYLLQLIGLLRLMLLILIVNHYIACCWFGITRLPDMPYTWVEQHLVEKGRNSLEYAYFTSLHWSLTQFTPASMEVFPTNVFERSYNVMVIVCAFCFISSFVSSITNAFSHMRNINAQAIARDTMIRRYFAENNISHGLAARVWHFVRQKHGTTNKRVNLEELPILQKLPVRIQDELVVEVVSPTLMRHPLLHAYFQANPTALRKVCKKGLAEQALPSGNYLKFEGEYKKMIFVVNGSLEFHMSEMAQEDTEECNVLEPGDWACEALLWADKAPLEGHFVAAPGGTDLLLLDCEVFRATALENFEALDMLLKYSTIFMDNFRRSMQDEQAVSTNCLFNSVEVLREMVVEATSKERRSLIRGWSGIRAPV